MRPPVERILDGEGVAAALAAAGIEIPGAQLDRAWPWRDGVCALYRQPRRRLERSRAVLIPGPAGPPAELRWSLAAGSLVRLPSLGGWAVTPGDDPLLAGARAAVDGAGAARRLRGRLPGGRLVVRFLRYKPLRRITLSYRAVDGDSGRQLFGKILRPAALERIEAAQRALAAAAGAMSLALPCDTVRRWGLQLFDPLPGAELERVIRGPAAARGVRLAASALAALHGCGARLPADHTREDELEVIDRWLECAGPGLGAVAPELAEVRGWLGQASESLPLGKPVPSHRDFHPGQLLVTADRAALLDLDTAATAEPELDLGNFLAHLDLMEAAGGALRVADLRQHLLAEYRRRAGVSLDAERLEWYRSGALLRLACVYRLRSGGEALGPRLVRISPAQSSARESFLEAVR